MLAVAAAMAGCTRATENATPAPPDGGDAQRLVALLDYVAGDYGRAVKDGKVESEFEYEEQLRFVADAHKMAAGLLGPTPAADDRVKPAIDRVESLVRARAAAHDVTLACRAAREDVVARFGLRTTPTERPSLARAEKLYVENCAVCHGAKGDADTERARALDPSPASFRDRERLNALAPFRVYNALTFGGARHRHGVVRRAAAFRSVEPRVLRVPPRARGRPRGQGGRGPAGRPRDPHGPGARGGAAGAGTSPARRGGRARAARGRLPGAARRRRHRRHPAHDPAGAARPPVPATSRRPTATRSTPTCTGSSRWSPACACAMRRRRSRSSRASRGCAAPSPGAMRPPAQLEAGASTSASSQLGGGAATRPFVAAFLIYFREGVEAALLVAALLAGVRRLGRARRAGATSTPAGWPPCPRASPPGGVLERVVRLGAEHRELVEGVVGILAAAVLFSVSFWMISKAESRHWMGYLRRQLESTLTRPQPAAAGRAVVPGRLPRGGGDRAVHAGAAARVRRAVAAQVWAGAAAGLARGGCHRVAHGPIGDEAAARAVLRGVGRAPVRCWPSRSPARACTSWCVGGYLRPRPVPLPRGRLAGRPSGPQRPARPARDRGGDRAVAPSRRCGAVPRPTRGPSRARRPGQPGVTGPRLLTLLGQPGCHLCQHEADRRRASRRRSGFRWRSATCATAPSGGRYRLEIPVLLHGGREVARHRVDRRRGRRLRGVSGAARPLRRRAGARQRPAWPTACPRSRSAASRAALGARTPASPRPRSRGPMAPTAPARGRGCRRARRSPSRTSRARAGLLQPAQALAAQRQQLALLRRATPAGRARSARTRPRRRSLRRVGGRRALHQPGHRPTSSAGTTARARRTGRPPG